MRNMAQTGSLSPAIVAAAVAISADSDASLSSGWADALGSGMLNAAENGLAIVIVASRSVEIEEKPSRYHPRPTGPTNRTSRVRYVSTSATDVRRDSAEHNSPIVEVARQVVAMIARNTNRVQNRPRNSGSRM